MDLNIILQSLGDFGKFQLAQYCLSLLPCMLYGGALISPVFLFAQPSHRCRLDECDNDQSNNLISNWKMPNSTKGGLDKCKRFTTLNSNLTCTNDLHFSDETESCNSFVYEDKYFISTASTKFNLVCDQEWKAAIATSIIYAAVFTAALTFGRLSDKFGRKAVFTWAPAVSILTSVGAAYAPNFIVFTLLLAIKMFCMTGMNQDGFVIGMELVGSKYRTICGALNLGAFATGQLVLAGTAYIFRDTFKFQLAQAALISLLLPLPWLLRESVRWCVSNGKGSEALATLKMAARWNDVELPEGSDKTIAKIISTSEENADDQSDESFLSAFKDPLICRWTLNLLLCWGINNLVYFGLAFQASNMSKTLSIYASSSLLSAVEIPFVFVMIYIMDKAGRKPTLMWFMVPAGLCCLLSAFVPETALFAGVLGKGLITGSSDSLFVYTIEIYPTKIRGSIIGACVAASRIGTMSAPHVQKLSAFGEVVPLLFCGIAAIISGLLVVDLPETLNRPFVETMEDAKNLKNISNEDAEALARSLSDLPLDKFPYNYPQFMLSSRRNTMVQPQPTRRHTIW